MTKNAGIPQYLQIADTLRTRLRQMPVGAPFQTEQELTAEFGVSRGTIRQALEILVHEGILLRTQGSGSFRTRQNNVETRFVLEKTLAESIRDNGIKSKIKDLSVTLVAAPPEIADMLGIPRGTKVRRVVRTRTIDDEPFAYAVGYLRVDLVPPFYKRDFKNSLSDLVRNTLHMHIETRGCECLACAADAVVAEALAIPRGTPVLKLCFICRGHGGEPMLLDTLCFTPNHTLRLVSSDD